MILPRRGESVDGKRRALLRGVTAEFVRQRVVLLKSLDEVRLFDVFNEEDLHRMCDKLGVRYRDRCFAPGVSLGLFVSQVLSRKDACSTMIIRFNSERVKRGLRPICTDPSGYCKARAKLPIKFIDAVRKSVVDIAHDKTLVQWKWMGLNAYLVDGLVLRAPDTEANQASYPQPSSQEEGLGFPQVRVVVTTSLATGCIVHYSTGPVEGKHTGEISLFREKHSEFAAQDVIVADSNFESFHDAVLLNKRGVALVCCINGTRKSPFQGVCKTIEEKLVTIDKPKYDKTRFTRAEWESLPDSITYRVIRYRVSGRNSEITIVTTLLDAKLYPAEEIAELYGLRWDVELDIRSYKSTMGMCDLRCQTPGNLDREIAVSVLGYNLVRLFMCDVAAVVNDIHPREISFSLARDTWQSFADQLTTTPGLIGAITSATSRLVRDRPNRHEPRAIKKRCHTKYSKLNQPRPSRARRMHNATASQREQQGKFP